MTRNAPTVFVRALLPSCCLLAAFATERVVSHFSRRLFAHAYRRRVNSAVTRGSVLLRRQIFEWLPRKVPIVFIAPFKRLVGGNFPVVGTGEPKPAGIRLAGRSKPWLPNLCTALPIFFLGAAIATSAPHSPPAYRIAGVVVDAITGAPVPHAEVSISPEGDQASMLADDGQFSFDGLEAGKKYLLSAAAPGYVNENYNQHWTYSTAIAVGNGLDSEHIVFRLHPQGVIYGTVTDDRGELVRHAQVTLFGIRPGQGHNPSGQNGTQTDDLGAYRFAHLLAGKYYLAVQVQPWYAQTGFAYAPGTELNGVAFRGKANPLLDVVYPITFYPAAVDEDDAVPLNLRAGDKLEANIQLTSVPAVHLRLTNLPLDASSVGVGVHQTLFEFSDIEQPVSVRKISPSEYEVAGLAPGKMALSIDVASGDQHLTRIIDANFGNGEILSATAGAARANVTGQVILASAMSDAVTGAVFLAKPGVSFPAQFQKDGAFSFASIPPGVYTVLVSLNSNDAYVQKLSAIGAKVAGRRVTLESSADVQLKITVAHGLGRVTGNAQLDGKPEEGVMVLLVPGSGEDLEEDARIDQSDSDGTFALANVVPGKYILMAIRDGWELDWKDSSVMKPYQENGQLIQIGPGQASNVTVKVQSRIGARQSTQ